jgi:hypothetical protein
MTNVFQRTNQKKIIKWTFLLLQRHHERLGLKAFGWAGPSGLWIQRIGFFFDSVRDETEGYPRPPRFAGEDLSRISMGTYQHVVGVQSGIQVHPDQDKRELRTEKDEMVEWYDRQLDIVGAYQRTRGTFPFQSKDGSKDDQRSWQAWQETAKKYLLTWEVFRYWLSFQKKPLAFYSLGSFPWDYVKPGWLDSAISAFLPTDPWDVIVLMGKNGEPAIFWKPDGTVVFADGNAIFLPRLAEIMTPADLAAHVLKATQKLAFEAVPED